MLLLGPRGVHAAPPAQPSEQWPGPWSLRSGLLKPRGGPLFLSPFSASEARKGVKQNLFSKQKEFSREREEEVEIRRE